VIPLDCLPLYEDAAFYDQEFRDRAHEIPFYLRRALASGGPVLELACGSGRITVPIAQAGVPIVGVDVSAPMIERARLRAAEAGVAIQWHVQDIRALSLERRFHLAFIATNALQHLHDLDSLVAFFQRARAHLVPDGLLLVDVFNPVVSKLARTRGAPRPHKAFTLDDGRRVEVDVDSEYLGESQILHFVLTYRHQGRAILTKDVRMRCLFPQELLALCRLGGFRVVERLGDHDGTAFAPDSPKQILCLSPTSSPGPR
jgi:SAM-dependent methyltransferase